MTTKKLTLSNSMLLTLAEVALLGPEGGAIQRYFVHSLLERKGLIQLTNNWAQITPEGLEVLAQEIRKL